MLILDIVYLVIGIIVGYVVTKAYANITEDPDMGLIEMICLGIIMGISWPMVLVLGARIISKK